MALETQVRNIPVSPSKGVDVESIEKQLTSMWSEASTSTAESPSGVIRACALNLIVYSTPVEDPTQLDELLNSVNEQHPGRSLILKVDREAREPRLEAYVSTRCRFLGGRGKQICGEQVTIEASGPTIETLPSAVAPLLIPDVPVYLWWKDIPHYHDKLFDRLTAMADRIVIDSSAFDHPSEDLSRLAIVIEERKIRVTDLNWGRLTTWRTLLASFWDIPDYRRHLDNIDSVAIKYSPQNSDSEEIPAKALLLASWLAARLGWQLVAKRQQEKRASEFDLRQQKRVIRLSFRKELTQKLEQEVLSSVTLSANQGEAAFLVALQAGATKLQTEARVGNEHSVGRVLSYERRSDAERLSRELSFISHDQVYEAALVKAVQILSV